MSNYLVDPNNCPTRDVKITGQVIGDNESNCALQLFANGVLCDTVSLAPLFAKEQDSVEGVDMLAWLRDTCQLQWTPQEGGTTTWNIADDIKNKLPIDLTFDPDTCTLKFTNLMGSCQTWNLIDALRAKMPTYRMAYDSDTHTLDFMCGGNTIESYVLNCGQFNFDPATCLLSYTNAKKQTRGFFIPQDQFAYDQASCTLTILPAKAGQAPVIIPTGATLNDVQFGTTPNCDGCSLRFTYKSKTVDVALPDMLVGCSFDAATNTLRMIHCSGMETNKVLPKATLQCNTLPDGTQVMVFDNGCPGGQKIFNIPGITLDTDDLTVVGSTLTFTYGGDGNPNTVIVDVCDLVAQNCNATFTAINPDGSWTFVDNAGNPFQYPAPKNCCTYLGNNPQVLTGTDPTDPAGNYANKTDGDTAIECHPNGISFWRCVDGAWDLGFTKTFANNLNYFASVDGDINPDEPPVLPPADPRYATKTDGDTVTVCHNNGFCAYTCTSGAWSLDWCKAFEDCCHYQVAVNAAIVPGTPPEPPAISGNKQEGDTLHACYVNGSAYYTCVNGAWVLDFIKLDANNCCTYMLESPTTLVDGEPITIVGAPTNKTDGDTAVQCHPNGMSAWTCVDGAWDLSWAKIFPTPVNTAEVQISDDEPDKASGIRVWFNCNDGCVYYCQPDGTWIAPKGCALSLPDGALDKPEVSITCENDPECTGRVNTQVQCNGEDSDEPPAQTTSYLEMCTVNGNANLQFDEAAWAEAEDTRILIGMCEIFSPKAGHRALVSGLYHWRGGANNNIAFDGNVQATFGVAVNDPTLSSGLVGAVGPVVYDSQGEESIDEKVITFTARSRALVKGLNQFYIYVRPGAAQSWNSGELNINQWQLNAAVSHSECC